MGTDDDGHAPQSSHVGCHRYLFGREDNIFWRRVRETPNKIEAVGAKALREGDAEPLGADIIHSVLNPIDRLTGAIQIYGGDFFTAERGAVRKVVGIRGGDLR
jgi:hypothetical protein